MASVREAMNGERSGERPVTKAQTNLRQTAGSKVASPGSVTLGPASVVGW
jgi:hypothetical protein